MPISPNSNRLNHWYFRKVGYPTTNQTNRMFTLKLSKCIKLNIYKILVDTYRTYGDELIGMIHHRYQQVEQHDDVDQGETPEHDEAPEPRELLDARKLEVVQIYETKSCPKQRLRGLPQTKMKQESDNLILL